VFFQSLKTTLPVAFGYIPLGMAFGVLLQNLGISWYWATAFGIFVYAGAAQFMAITLLSQKVGLAEVFSATLLLNLRHVFYGIGMIPRFSQLKKHKWYAIFGLTDETFSILTTSNGNQNDSQFIFFATLFNQIWWVIGCTLGALLRTHIKFDSTGLEFSLTCLFVVLLLEQWFKTKDWFPIILGCFFGCLALVLFGGKNFLLVSLLGVMLATPFKRKEIAHAN
jgi:4-azaleucine resistance transporter AzlC